MTRKDSIVSTTKSADTHPHANARMSEGRAID